MKVSGPLNDVTLEFYYYKEKSHLKNEKSYEIVYVISEPYAIDY